MSVKLTILEIRQDAELLRLGKLLNEIDEQYHARIMQLFKENDIKPLEFHHGFGLSDNSTSFHSVHLPRDGYGS